MAYTTPWERPYPGVSSLQKDQIVRITVEIPRLDAEAIIAVTHTSHILTTIAQSALKETANVCRTNSLSYADFPGFVKYLRERTYSRPLAETPAPHVGTRDAGVREGVETPRPVATVLGQGTTGGSGGESKEGDGRRVRRRRDNQRE